MLFVFACTLIYTILAVFLQFKQALKTPWGAPDQAQQKIIPFHENNKEASVAMLAESGLPNLSVIHMNKHEKNPHPKPWKES